VSALRPRLHDGVFAFVCVPPDVDTAGWGVVASILEAEGRTLVLPEPDALAAGLEIRWRGRWLTLEAQTSLSMVGLTARFASALAAAGVACNGVAGACHDHVFVPPACAGRALAILAAIGD